MNDTVCASLPLDKLNRVVTAFAASTSSIHVPVPEQLPDHSLKSERAAGVAVSVTLLPACSEAEHTQPQSIRTGWLEVTRP
jgi:hypothetical protein